MADGKHRVCDRLRRRAAQGFMSYPSGTNWGQIQQVGTGTSGAFTYAGLLNLITSLKEPYQAGASWLVKRASVASIMLIQDGNGRYIFQPIVGGNFNNTSLLGYNLKYANDMPAVAAGALAAAFGDFKRGYVIVDRVGLSVLRDAYTSKPNILFYTRKRTGGDCDDFDALKIQVLT
jgi:HK97 family phage major capsid protein